MLPWLDGHSQVDSLCMFISKEPIRQKAEETCRKNIVGSHRNGTIDSCWGMMKDSVPDQLPTCKKRPVQVEWLDLDLCPRLAVEMAKPCSWSSPFEKKMDPTWRRCNVTSKMRCRCGFATNQLRNKSFFQVPNLQFMQKNAGEIVNRSGMGPENWHASSKKPCKTHDCQDSNYQKNAILHGRKTTRRDVWPRPSMLHRSARRRLWDELLLASRAGSGRSGTLGNLQTKMELWSCKHHPVFFFLPCLDIPSYWRVPVFSDGMVYP